MSFKLEWYNDSIKKFLEVETMKNNGYKIIALLLVVLTLLTFAACKKDDSDVQPSLTVPEDASSIEDEIKITVPLSSIDEEYRNDLDAYCEKFGYSSAKLNKKDQTVTITCNAFRHELLLVRIGMRVIDAIYDLEKSKKYPYLVSVDSINRDDFSEAVITVKRKGFQDLLPFVIGQDLLLYQMYEGSGNYGVTVVVNDEKGELIDTFHYSDKDE